MTLDFYLKHTKPSGDCLEWTRCVNSDGYPRAGKKGNSNLKVHREVFFLVNGFYPPVVRHSCDNIICINPEHLLAGINLDNIQDRSERGRTHNHVPGERKERVLNLREQGWSYKKIAKELNITTKQVDATLYRTRKAG